MRARVIFIAALLAVVAGCEPISDPWVGKNEMQNERARSEQQQAILRERLERGQTDR